jgi:hypothetical protein
MSETTDTTTKASRLSYYQPRPEKQALLAGDGYDVGIYSGEFYSHRFAGGDGHCLVPGFRIVGEWGPLNPHDGYGRDGEEFIGGGGVFGRTKSEALGLALSAIAETANNTNRVARIVQMLLSVKVVEDNCADVGDIMHSADLAPMASEISDWAFECHSTLRDLARLIADGCFAEDFEPGDGDADSAEVTR